MSCQSISNARIEHISYECDKSRHGYGAALTLSDKERSCRNFFIIMRELLYQSCFGLRLVTKTLVICQAKQAKHAREMEALQFKAKQEKLEASRQLDEVSQQEKLRVWLEYEDGTWWCRTAWTNIFIIWLIWQKIPNHSTKNESPIFFIRLVMLLPVHLSKLISLLPKQRQKQPIQLRTLRRDLLR